MGVRKQERDALRAATFQEIFEQNWSRVRRHIECVIDDPDEASDLVSDGKSHTVQSAVLGNPLYATAWISGLEGLPEGKWLTPQGEVLQDPCPD